MELCRHHFWMDGTRWVAILGYGTLAVTNFGEVFGGILSYHFTLIYFHLATI